MAETNSSELPNWVCKRDGRLVAFDADEICQTIFAATEELQQPSAFLAREMTESVLHFLVQEHGSSTPTTTQIAELVAKVLRELGQPALAQTVAGAAGSEKRHEPAAPARKSPLPEMTPPREYLDACRREYSLQAVFSRDVVAAQEEGWLTLVGLEHPEELEGGVVDWPTSADRSLLSALLQARRRFGSFVVLDSPEYALPAGHSQQRHIAALISDLHDGLQATGLRAVINVNTSPPSWAEQPGDGPLFGRAQDARSPEPSSSALNLLDALLDRFAAGDLVRVDWHLKDRDFAARLTDLSRMLRKLTLPGSGHGFVFDRPGVSVALGEGLDRRHPAVLQVTGLHLAPLLDMPGIDGNIDLLLQKLVHLTRMAVSSGTQKRQSLRRQESHHGDLQRGFLLDRARLTVVPVGLSAVAQRLQRELIGRDRKRPEFAPQIVQRLRQCLIESGRSANLEAVLDSPWWTNAFRRAGNAGDRSTGALFRSPHLVGLTCADHAALAEDQLRAAGTLHQIAGSGTATLLMPAGSSIDDEPLMRLLRFVWEKTDIVRLRFARSPGPAEETLLGEPGRVSSRVNVAAE